MNWEQLKAYVNEPERTRVQLERVAKSIDVNANVVGNLLLHNINRRIESRIKSEGSAAMSGFTLPVPRTRNGGGNTPLQQRTPRNGGDNPPPREPRDDDEETERNDIMRNIAGFALAGVVGAIALIFLGLLTFFVIDRLADDDDDTAANSGAKYAADTFGGNASDWKIAPNSGGSGWVYEGPPTEIKVPEDHRIDYPGASCAEAGTSGVYGPLTLERSGPLTVWSVPGETKCPTTTTVNNTNNNPPANNGGQTNNTTDTSTTNNSNNQSTNEPVVNTRAGCNAAIVNNEGYPGPTTAQAKVDTGIDVQRLGTECSAFVFRHPHGESSPTTCKTDYVCTLTLSDGSVKVFVGDDKERMASAATYRWVDGYPENDKVHEDPPCKLARSEDRFGAGEDPAFVATAGNFSCGGGQSYNSNSPQPAAVTTLQCGDPAEQLGGSWVREGNKMSLQGTAEITGHPAWTIHTPGYPGDPGLPPGSFETTGTASAYCDPYKG